MKKVVKLSEDYSQTSYTPAKFQKDMAIFRRSCVLLKDTGLKKVDELANCRGDLVCASHVNPMTSMVAGDSTGVSE